MAIHKLGTDILKAFGLQLEVHSCAQGYMLVDPRFFAQTTPTYETAFEAVNEAMIGARPKETSQCPPKS